MNTGARVSPRTVLLSVFLAVLLALGLYALGPWILPVRIIEGPLVQLPSETGATLIWYTTRQVSPERLQVLFPETTPRPDVRISCEDRRGVARISGLPAGAAAAYRVTYGARTLAEARLHTDKAAGQPFAFIVFGDSGDASAEQYLLAGRMEQYRADFLLHTGDLIYPRGQRDGYESRFFAPYRRMIAETPFWPALGNHDVSKQTLGEPYLAVFELPRNGPVPLPAERNYWFDYADARIAVVDSNLDEFALRTHVAPWLKEVLAGPDRLWKFVVAHHPPYTAGSHRPADELQRALVPTFENAGVDIVFSGHDHNYQRTRPLRQGASTPPNQGVVYIISGAGGARLYELQAQRPDWLAAGASAPHSFTLVEIDGPRLKLTQIGLDGRVLDEREAEQHVTSTVPIE